MSHILNFGMAVTVAAVVLLASTAPSHAAIYTEDFNSYAGNQNAAQAGTGLPVAHTGGVAGWSQAGAGAMHAVQLNGTPDWAIMFYMDNAITSSAISGANANGVDYELTFDYGTADYAGGQGTGATDGLIVEIQRSSNSSVIATQNYLPGIFQAGNYNLEGGLTGTLSYTGDGSGDVQIFVRTINNAANAFGGEIDNLVLDTAPVPEPSSFALAVLGMTGLGWFSQRARRHCVRL